MDGKIVAWNDAHVHLISNTLQYGFGVFEGTFGMGLHLVGVPLNVAMASSLVLHVAELLFVVSLAPVALLLRVSEVESAHGMS